MSSPVEDMEIIDLGDGFDAMIFSQILEMDDSDSDRSFSRELVVDYLSQARDTFAKIRAALKKRDLPDLYDLGHYLKGSSAAIGLTHVQVHCQKIQQYGKLQDIDEKTLTPEAALDLISTTLEVLITDFEAAETKLRDFYGDFDEFDLPAIPQGGAETPQEDAEDDVSDNGESDNEDEDNEDDDAEDQQENKTQSAKA
ncbi:hypothetical protein BROUX41_005191 [Berkeleyomyces rouxiae]|uniref:uncharacterized protein n=1 Tax=Berkeleyomyces rouxiae TaxID=2035830 RepID=UPI003B7DF57A